MELWIAAPYSLHSQFLCICRTKENEVTRCMKRPPQRNNKINELHAIFTQYHSQWRRLVIEPSFWCNWNTVSLNSGSNFATTPQSASILGANSIYVFLKENCSAWKNATELKWCFAFMTSVTSAQCQDRGCTYCHTIVEDESRECLIFKLNHFNVNAQFMKWKMPATFLTPGRKI